MQVLVLGSRFYGHVDVGRTASFMGLSQKRHLLFFERADYIRTFARINA